MDQSVAAMERLRRVWLDQSMTNTNATDIVLVLATVTVGLTAGVMFCYQIAIMPGLHQLADRDFIRAFQRIDEKIVNPLFVLVSFFGGAALLIAATALQDAGTLTFTLLAIATVIYVTAVVLLTMVWHVPRNNALARFPVATATDDDAARARARFEGPWSRLHIVRTLASIVALALLAASLLEGSA
jgi:uncharacterized membrane protein